MSSNIQKDYRFDVQIDDPHFSEAQNKAKEVLVQPIYASNDNLNGIQDSKMNYPRAVVILINKTPNSFIKEKMRIL